MELQLRNIGMIKEADIILDKLTLIAGENDTGKSTVGKALYSVVSGLNNAEKHYSFLTKQNIMHTKLYVLKKIENAILMKTKEKKSKIYNIYINEKNKYDNINYFISHIRDDIISEIFNKNIKYGEFINKLKKYELYDSLEKDINKLELLLNENIEDYKKKYISIRNQIELEFIDAIQSFKSNKSNISILDNENNKIIDINIENNEIDESVGIGNIEQQDITYIESPFVFYIRDVFDRYEHYFGARISELEKQRKEARFINSIYTNHVDNLFTKLSGKKIINNNNTISNSIASIIGGFAEYNKQNRKLLFKKNDNYIELSNTAVGIKSFAMIDLLLKYNIFYNKHILILDEPEVHLHPKWQIEYAKIMVEMAEKLDIQILINSHSPYFIEAIQKYSENSEKIADRTNFYLSEKLDDSYAIIKNVNNNIESIYKTLADAYRKLDKDTLWNEVKNDIR
ncbi:AAA family ATPase [Brachyspira pilosicoli]|uniref:AAA family ATPase n=1 Tax=Brachyspira pilosicoli TaxID=52584 RepID=UPI00300580D3